MIYRQSNTWFLWGGVHPDSIGCTSEGREQCTCKYHIVDKAKTQIFSFDDFQKADEKFCSLTGMETFQNTLFKKNNIC